MGESKITYLADGLVVVMLAKRSRVIMKDEYFLAIE